MKILFATSNKHKVKEANKVGREFGVEFEQLLLEYPEIRDDDVIVCAWCVRYADIESWDECRE